MEEYLKHYVLAKDKISILERLLLEAQHSKSNAELRNIILPLIEIAPPDMKEFLMELAFETQKSKGLEDLWDLKLFALKSGRQDLSNQVHDLIKDSIVKEISVYLLANWCHDIDKNGTSWDDWDENYKEAAYRIQGPFRLEFDETLAEIRQMHGE